MDYAIKGSLLVKGKRNARREGINSCKPVFLLCEPCHENRVFKGTFFITIKKSVKKNYHYIEIILDVPRGYISRNKDFMDHLKASFL